MIKYSRKNTNKEMSIDTTLWILDEVRKAGKREMMYADAFHSMLDRIESLEIMLDKCRAIVRERNRR